MTKFGAPRDMVGTLDYVAPEVFRLSTPDAQQLARQGAVAGCYDAKVDIWDGARCGGQGAGQSVGQVAAWRRWMPSARLPPATLPGSSGPAGGCERPQCTCCCIALCVVPQWAC